MGWRLCSEPAEPSGGRHPRRQGASQEATGRGEKAVELERLGCGAAVKPTERKLIHAASCGCLQLLEIYWNLKTLLEISWNLCGLPGNFYVTCRWSTLVSNHDNTGYWVAYLRNWSPFFIFATVLYCAYHVFVLYLGKLLDSVHCIAGQSNADMSWIFLEIPPGNLLEICSVKFVGTLQVWL